MAEITFSGSKTRRVPINRNSLFYDKDSFNVEMEIGKNYIEQDMGQAIVLYQVDASKTQADAVYGETTPSSVVYKTPVEIPCVYKVEAPELKSYDKDKQLGTYNKGDYVGVQITPELMLYYVINNVNPNYDNAHTLWGTIPLYYTATCSAVDSSEFKA